jgi:hypothetical protein
MCPASLSDASVAGTPRRDGTSSGRIERVRCCGAGWSGAESVVVVTFSHRERVAETVSEPRRWDMTEVPAKIRRGRPCDQHCRPIRLRRRQRERPGPAADHAWPSADSPIPMEARCQSPATAITQSVSTMPDEPPFYSPKPQPRRARQPKPGELLFECRNARIDRVRCELRDHREVGVEVQ